MKPTKMRTNSKKGNMSMVMKKSGIKEAGGIYTDAIKRK